MDKQRKRTWGDWYLIAIGGGVGSVLLLSLAGKVGLIEEPFPPVVARSERPEFDNQECLNRNQYEIRRNDPTISDDMLFGDVARRCIIEKQEFYGQ